MYQPLDFGGATFVWGLLGVLALALIAPIWFATLTGWLCGRRSLGVGGWRGIGRGFGVGILGVALNVAVWWAVLTPDPPAPWWLCLSVVPLLGVFVAWRLCRRRRSHQE